MKKIVLLICCVTCMAAAYSNNIQIVNLSITGNNTTNKTVLVKFDVSWDNSWRTSFAPTNYDAAWVFIKYKDPTTLEWKHATISTLAGDHVSATGSIIKPSPDGVGAMVYRSAEGSGTVNYANTQLMWKYGVDGLNTPVTDITVMGIEMVYVTEGSFYLGDGNGAASSSPYSYYIGTSGTKQPVQITSAISNTIVDPINSNAIRISGNGGVDFNNDGVIDNANFPTGYKASWCMKYEISRGQYGAFLQLLNSGQRGSRLDPNAVSYFTSTYAATIPDRAMDILNWDDIAAYCDWSGLRPMTELEYEKVTRAFTFPSLKDLAFGGLTDAVICTGLTNAGTPTEISSGPAGANMYINQGVTNPCRVGLFATGSTTRVSSGASYFGIMNLSDNVSEYVVTTYFSSAIGGTTADMNYAGNHGDGKLSTSGFANQTSWPVGSAETFKYLRGGRYSANAMNLADGYCSISSRSDIGVNNSGNNRSAYFGGRCVRSDW